MCECKNIISQRFKDLILDTNQGEKTITIYVFHCEDCGMVHDITQK